MNPSLEIFSQGEEIVTGQTVDTNAAWLAQECTAMGFTVKRHTAVGDRLDELVALLHEISSRADCCICTGGLGPTSDDLTAEATAMAFSAPLRFDPVALDQITSFFKHRNRAMPEINRKQAFFPDGAQRIDNPWGTAPGFMLRHDRCLFFFLPGVPYEMRHLFNGFVKNILEKHYALQPKQLITIKTIGIGESDIQTALAGIVLPREIQLGFRAGPDHIETKLSFPAYYPQDKIDCWVDEISGRLGHPVFGIDSVKNSCDDIASTIDGLMRGRRLTAAFIETLSQGLMAAKCNAANGWLLETLYHHSAERLAERFSVTFDDTDLASTAEGIANAYKQRNDASLILVQLYRQSDTLHDQNRTITLHNTLLGQEGFRHSTQSIGGSAKRKQNQAALMGLDLLRRYLQNLDY